MKVQELERYRFDYQNGRVMFDVFFFIDETPFVLLFGAKGYNFSFEFKVERGFRVMPHMNHEEFRALCDALGLIYNPTNPFSPKVFLSKFAKKIPGTAHKREQAKPEHVAKYRRFVEEVDKIYFYRWRNNHTRGQTVSLDNLDKTRLLLGLRAYEICKRKNISSCWTDQKKQSTEFYWPNSV